MPESLEIAGTLVERGARQKIDIPIGSLPNQTEVAMRVEVVRGAQDGPRLFIAATIHGDELNGIDTVRQVMEALDPEQLSGAVIGVPIVNVFGFLQSSRYLPDRRDLNRSFPGSSRGSLAGRLAHLFTKEIVAKSTHGIDLHAAAVGRYNLPHVRADFDVTQLESMAEAFGAPVAYHSRGPEKSVRRTATKTGTPVLLFEGGEAGRFDPEIIDMATGGTLRVMRALGMIADAPESSFDTVRAEGATWVRAKRAGLARMRTFSGEKVKKRQRLGTVADAFGDGPSHVVAPCDGIVISHTTNPSVNQGDAIIHIARI